MEAVVDHDDGCYGTADHGMEEKHEEVFVIVHADAVTDPWAMMVHSHDATRAHGAMVCSWWPYRLAFHTVSPVDKAPDLAVKLGEYFFLYLTPLLVR